MDTLDNANATNPFVNSNNADIHGPKDGFVLNLAEGRKQNGTENVADFLERSANGKRTADEFDDDDDLGPETDVDCVDEICVSPTPSPTPLQSKTFVDELANNNPIEKAAMDAQKYETLREETPTPPADSVQDTSGLVDNVADSGEESEDEWNYFKGDQAEKENVSPSENNRKISDLDLELESDTMSQLNPNAAEFVPVSPKRDVTSPVYQALMDDLVLAQSPKRFTNKDIDIKVPNPQEFETEIKSRPGDLIDESDNVNNLSSQEIMENFLNGKPIEEIDFQPSAPKASEFHFGPNSTPFSTPGKFMDQSIKAVIGDETNYLNDSLNDDLHNSNKEANSMSMSFYGEEESNLDLNKVQVLPDNLDEFLDKNEVVAPPIEVEVNVCERLSPFKDNLSVSSGNLGSQSSIPDLQSPMPDGNELLIETVSPKPEQPVKSPFLDDLHEEVEVKESPIPSEELECTKESVVEQSNDIITVSAEPTQSELIPISSPTVETEASHNFVSEVETEAPHNFLPEIIDITDSPILAYSEPVVLHTSTELSLSSPIRDSNPFLVDLTSPIPSLLQDSIPRPNSVEINDLIKTESVKSYEPPTDLPLTPTKALPSPPMQSPLSPTPLIPAQPTESPLLDSPVDDITSSVKDSPLPVASPTEPIVADSPRSIADTESVATTDVNSFLERSLIPDLASPLSGDETQLIGNIEIHTEIIAPEFPVQTVTTPSEDAGDLTLVKEKTASDKPKLATAASTKKVPSKSPATVPPKAAVKAKAAPKPAPAKPAPTAASRSLSKPAPSKPTVSSRLAEKKPIANGDAKPLVKKSASALKTTATTAAKTNPAKPATTKMTLTSARIASAGSKPAPKVAAAKPSPTAVKQTKPPTVPATKPAQSAPKPKTAIPPTKPRTLTPKLSANAPDTEKQIKESTNKLLTASASTNRISSPGKPPATTARKLNVKSTTQTKTTVDAKKPVELVRHTSTKPKTTTIGIKKTATKTVTNGITTKVSSTITTETKLMKDVSPIVEKKIVDNSQIQTD